MRRGENKPINKAVLCKAKMYISSQLPGREKGRGSPVTSPYLRSKFSNHYSSTGAIVDLHIDINYTLASDIKKLKRWLGEKTTDHSSSTKHNPSRLSSTSWLVLHILGLIPQPHDGDTGNLQLLTTSTWYQVSQDLGLRMLNLKELCLKKFSDLHFWLN